jgi:hypothetical protein
MMGLSKHGIARAAGRLGITPDEYRQHVADGESWCSDHKAWEPRESFYIDRVQARGVSGRCRAASRQYWLEYRSVRQTGIRTIHGAQP